MLPFLTLRDGNCVRIVCRELRDAVAEAPWRDAATRIPSTGVGAWHVAFPRAKAANLSDALDRYQARRWQEQLERRRLCDADLACVASCSVVDLSGQSAITDDGLAHLRAVRELKLSGVGVFGIRVERLTDASLRRVNNPALKQLTLDRCAAITGDGLAAFGQLEVLVLRGTNIKPAAFYNLRSLTELTWTGNSPLPEAALLALAAVAPGRLRVLEADNITAAGLRACTGLSTLRLHRPDLRANPLTGADFVSTRPTRALSRLSFRALPSFLFTRPARRATNRRRSTWAASCASSAWAPRATASSSPSRARWKRST